MTDVVVYSLDDIAQFLREWEELYVRMADRSFFLSPDWIGAWLEGRPRGGRLLGVRAASGSQTVLLGALGRPAEGWPFIPARAHLHEYGAERLDTIYIEDNDFLIAPGAPADCRAEALKALCAHAGVDRIVLRNSTLELARAADEAAAALGWKTAVLRRQPVFAIDLDLARKLGGGALAASSSALRAKVARALRRYEEFGPVSLTVANTDEQARAVWSALKDLHQRGWTRRGREGAFANDAFLAFHARLRKRAPAAAQLIQVDVDGVPIGCLYNFLHEGRVLNYQSGFRFEDDNQLTPGLLTHALAAQHYLDQGYRSYDLLAGDAEYKRRLASETGELTTLVLENASAPRMRVRRALRSMRRRPF